MSKVIEFSDEQYRAIERAATSQGQTLSDFIARWIDALRAAHVDAHYYETEEWFRHLGATEEQIAESARLADEDSDAGANAHAWGMGAVPA